MKHIHSSKRPAIFVSGKLNGHQLIRNGIRAALFLCLCCLMTNSANALEGAFGIHDPSSIIERDGVYHIWGTGNQTYHLTSTDLIGWSIAPTVFPAGQWPSWINTYVPGFNGAFWAPAVVFLNGKYYLYYSCSTGGRPSAIGLATSTDLSNWTDQGMVVFSDFSTPYGSIDASVFQDARANLWLVFGSHLNGIWMAQLDPATGKRLNATLTNVAPVSDAEAGFVIRRGDFYYLFYNRGICCAGTSSTYNVQMGRSTSPTGPYLDRNGAALSNAGGTTFLSTSGRYIGPGQVGYFSENGVEYLTYHFYDGNLNGTPTMRLSNLRWDSAGWPFASADWINNGRYKIRNQGNNLAWENWGCTGNSLEPIAQGSFNRSSLCQQWDFTSLGNGAYKITSAQSGLAADVFNCSPNAGAKLDIFGYWGGSCQQFNIERASNGSYVIASVNGNMVVDVPNANSTPGTQLQTWFYNGFSAQKWLISSAIPLLLTEENGSKAIALDSVTMVRDPFPFTNPNYFGPDQRTRIAIFAVGLELMPGEDNSAITAQAEDGAHNIYPLTIEYVGQAPNVDGLTQVVVKLPDALDGAGDVWFSIGLGGATSNRALVSIR